MLLPRLQEKARSEKDIIKLNCVNEKAFAIKGYLKVAEGAQGNLANASTVDDRNHAFSQITIAFQKVTILEQEMEECAGQAIGEVGDESKVEVDVDPDTENQSENQDKLPNPQLARAAIASPSGL